MANQTEMGVLHTLTRVISRQWDERLAQDDIKETGFLWILSNVMKCLDRLSDPGNTLEGVIRSEPRAYCAGRFTAVLVAIPRIYKVSELVITVKVK